ncbi:MAG: acetamidase/formamidase family protein, partial [Chloroflexi bacterium]|nr:acetamidase/formamidase family protein [Chloroflexota bacterium]
MATFHFRPSLYHTTLGPHEPVLHIADGDTVITTTVDAYGNDERDQNITARGNPQTGPFYIQGAEPGDVLQLHLDRLWPNRDAGYTSTMVAENVVEPDYVRELPAREMAQWHLDRTQGTATLIKPETRLGQFT